MAKLVVKESKPKNYVVLAVLLGVLFYLLFVRR